MCDTGNKMQLTFFDGFCEHNLNQDHDLVILDKLIDWDKLIEIVITSGKYSNLGRKTISLKMQLGLQILKTMYSLSDEQVVEQLCENIYFMSFCGTNVQELSEMRNHGKHNQKTSRNPFDPSCLTYFRKRLKASGMKELEESITCLLIKLGELKGKKNVSDTTVLEKNIIYPTDIGLLHKCGKKLFEYVKHGKQLKIKSMKIVKTNVRKMKKVFLNFIKLGKKTKEKSQESLSEINQLVSRTTKQVLKAISKISTQGSRVKKQFKCKGQKLLETCKRFLEQTQKVLSGLKNIPDRIVSFHEQHVRPICKGKFNKPVEFGSKVLLNMENGYITNHKEYIGNPSDSNLLEDSINLHKEIFGDQSLKESGYDRGFNNKVKVEHLEEANKIKISIPPVGRATPREDRKYFDKRMQRMRAGIEGKNSDLKNNYGMNKSRYKGFEGDKITVSLSVMTCNLKRLARRVKNNQVNLKKVA